MQTPNTRNSSSVQPPCLRRAQSLPNALDQEVVGIPLFWFKAPKRKIAKFKDDSKPPRQRLPQFPRLGRLRAHMMSPAVDTQLPDLLSLQPSLDTNQTHQTVHSTETSDTIDDDTWSTYSSDDENEKSYLHGLSFLDETDETEINESIF
jgi:hypothetical protein